MKYIKKFEVLEWQELYKIHFLFYHFLDKIKIKEERLEFIVTPLYFDYSYKDIKGYIVGFQIKYEDYRGSFTKLLFTIRVTSQNYGPDKNKLLIYFDNSKPIDIYTSKNYIWNIINFIKDKLSKYAKEEVLENKITKYVLDKSEINSLIKELYDDYPVYTGTDMKLQTIGISPKDSQLLESRNFNVLDIARFFNTNPILLFDNTKGTYNNVENAQLDFLNTTLLPIIEKLENEFVRKLILPSQRGSIELRFDLANLLRADQNSQAEYYQKLFGMGVVNANYIAKTLNLPKIEGDGGDRFYISTNLQDSNNLIVNQNNSIDNKLK